MVKLFVYSILLCTNVNNYM